VLGIGVNIESNPDNTVFAAANLKQFNIEITKEILLQKFLENFEKQYQNWLDFGFVNIRKAFLQKAYRLKQKITVNNNGEKIEGIFEDIDKDGALILSTALGTKKIFAGDVFDLLR